MAFLKWRVFQGLGTLLPNTYAKGFLTPSLYQGMPKEVFPTPFNCLKVVVDHKRVVRYAHVGAYSPEEGGVSSVIGDLVKEMKKGNGHTASLPR